MATIVTWAGVDDPERLDRASVELAEDSMRAFGSSHTRSFATTWSLDVGAGWVTRSIDVTVRSLGWWRSLTLTRHPDGRWESRHDAEGRVDLPSPGLADPASVEGALDCDLALSPVTNTMPVRRLGLLDAVVPPTPLVLAWVDVPSLQVVRDEQVYASAGDGTTPRHVAFSSPDGEGGVFRTRFTVDEDGLVLDYPGIARRVGPAL